MPSTPLPVRALAVVATAGTLIIGLFALSRLAPSYDSAIAVGAGWMLACALVAGKLVKGRPDLRWPVRLTTIAVSAAVLAWVGYTTFSDKEVDERVVTGVRAQAAQGSGSAGSESSPPSARRPQNVEVARGTFRRLSHGPSRGTAAVVELADGGRRLTLRRFETDNGPDLRVYLATDESAREFRDLGALKGNKGDQQYEVPRGVDVSRYDTVLIWCRAFSVGFAEAQLD